MMHMKLLRLLFLVPVLALAQAPTAPPSPATTATSHRQAWEGVVGFRGKVIGTSILLEIASDGAVNGWIQRNDFFPIDSGRADPEHIKFTSGGNSYDINLRTERITYTGPDGQGNQRVTKMSYVQGVVYRIAEPMLDLPATVTIRNEDGDRAYNIDEPAIWKRSEAPLDRLGYERWKDILGKTTGLYLSRLGGSRVVSIMEEPEGMDLLKRQPKAKKEPKKQ